MMAVYLDGDDDLVREVESQGVDTSNGNHVVKAILANGDDRMKSKFESISSDISRGTMMHKLSARYWKQRRGADSTSQKQENVWRRLCAEYLSDTVEEKQMMHDFGLLFPQDSMLAPMATSSSRSLSRTFVPMHDSTMSKLEDEHHEDAGTVKTCACSPPSFFNCGTGGSKPT